MPAGSASEVFGAFLRLGLTSFGGPVAHLGYFRAEFVVRRRWLDEARYAQLLALCQFLPGPASSQMGFAIGLLRAGWGGALAAFVAFTAPAALLMFAFASLAPADDSMLYRAAIHGLKLVAVVVVASGVLGMARTLAAIALGALAGLLACRTVAIPAAGDWPVAGTRFGPAVYLALFAGGLALAAWQLRTPIAAGSAPTPALLAAALYDPVWVEAVGSIGDVAIVAAGFVLQVALRMPALGVVLWCVGASLVTGLLASPVGS